MTARTVQIQPRGTDRRTTPRRRAVEPNPHVLDAARLMLTGVLAMLGFVGITGLATGLAAMAPPPCAGPAPGLP